MVNKSRFSIGLWIGVLLLLFPMHVRVAIGQQADIVGDWAHPGPAGGFSMFEDVMDRGAGPDPGQWLGIPFNEAGRSRALTWMAGWQSVPERQCVPHPVTYHIWGPGTLTIRRDYDASRRVVAFRFDGTYGLDRVVWMDGRPHPPPDAPHTYTGFSTGKWDGDSLVVETSQIKPAFIRRNGAFLSEKARLVERFARHGRYLVHTMAVDDPIYLAEPFVRTTEYELDPRPPMRLGRFGVMGDEPVFYKCFPAEELGGDRYAVPHWLPGSNPLPSETATKLGLPAQSLLGGPQTMYPEYMRELANPTGPSSAVPPGPTAQTPLRESGPIRSVHVRGNVWAVMGAGANITVQVGEEGVLLVDSGSEEMSGAVRAEIDKIAPGKPIRYVINTHWHTDHTGGNVALSDPTERYPQRAALLAHEKVAASLAKQGLPAADQVMDTFFGPNRTIYFNGEPIEIVNIASAHTDGDALVFFRKSDVVSAGDAFVTYSYPRFARDDGATVAGTIAALNRIIDVAVSEFRQQGGTLIIPGHGRLYDETDVVEYRDMISIIRDRVQDSIKKGKTLEQIKAEHPTLDYDGVYGSASGPWTTEMFVTAVYEDLSPVAGSAQ